MSNIHISKSKLLSFLSSERRQSERGARASQPEDMRIDYLREFSLSLCLSPRHILLPPRRWPVNLPPVTVCAPIKYGRNERGRDGRLDGWKEGGGKMQARRRASEVGGWLEESFCNSSVSPPLPPTSLMSLQVSLSLLISLTQYIIQSPSPTLVFLPPPTLSLALPIYLFLSLPVFQQIVFSQSFISAATWCLALASSLSDIITGTSHTPIFQLANDIKGSLYYKYTGTCRHTQTKAMMPGTGWQSRDVENRWMPQKKMWYILVHAQVVMLLSFLIHMFTCLCVYAEERSSSPEAVSRYCSTQLSHTLSLIL